MRTAPRDRYIVLPRVPGCGGARTASGGGWREARRRVRRGFDARLSRYPRMQARSGEEREAYSPSDTSSAGTESVQKPCLGTGISTATRPHLASSPTRRWARAKAPSRRRRTTRRSEEGSGAARDASRRAGQRARSAVPTGSTRLPHPERRHTARGRVGSLGKRRGRGKAERGRVGG